MNYTLQQLRIFQKVAQTGHVTRAAEELHLTQPAVSIQLKNFQDQFELPLFEIIHKRLYITDFGQEVAVSAQRILDEINSVQFKMHQHLGALTGKLKLSVVSTGKYIAPYFVTDFMNKHTGIELVMDVTNKALVLESLAGNMVDFAFVSVLPEQLPVNKIKLMQNKLFLIGNKEAISSNKELNSTILKEVPLIYREEGSGTRYVMERFIRKQKIPVTKKMELQSNEAVKQAVIAGLGYSIMPLIGVKNELMNGQLQIIPVKGFPIESSWNLIWMQDKKLSPVAQAFLNYVRSEKQHIIQTHFGWYENYG